MKNTIISFISFIIVSLALAIPPVEDATNTKVGNESTSTKTVLNDDSKKLKDSTYSGIKPATDTKIQSYFLKNNKMVEYVDGQMNIITKTLTLTNGTSVTPAGLVKTAAGSTTQLKNGDAIDKNGNITYFKPTVAPKEVSPN